MNKKWFPMYFLLFAYINISISVYFMHNIYQNTLLLTGEHKKNIELEKTLYDISSLDKAITMLKKNMPEQRVNSKSSSGIDPLQLTGEILQLFRNTNITVEKYKIQGENNGKELFIQGKGTIEDVTMLLYTISFSNPKFRINFLSVDTGRGKTPVNLVMRITYA